MTANASTGADLPKVDEYDEMLDHLDTAIEEARYKIEEGRIRDEAKERCRIKWVRALAYAVNVRRQVTHDRDLEELSQEVEELKADRPEVTA